MAGRSPGIDRVTVLSGPVTNFWVLKLIDYKLQDQLIQLIQRSLTDHTSHKWANQIDCVQEEICENVVGGKHGTSKVDTENRTFKSEQTDQHMWILVADSIKLLCLIYCETVALIKSGKC